MKNLIRSTKGKYEKNSKIKLYENIVKNQSDKYWN